MYPTNKRTLKFMKQSMAKLKGRNRQIHIREAFLTPFSG
jgi:hypothetical protein